MAPDINAIVDTDAQVAHWRDAANIDWDVAGELLQTGRRRHALFFMHLALEKALRAHVCRTTRDVAPRLHNLVRLAELAGIELTTSAVDVLAEMNEFALAARSPDVTGPVPAEDEARGYQSRADAVLQWLIRAL